jgi:CBS domain-containing protein
MQAKDVMTGEVVTIGPEADVRDLARLLLEHGISGVPVLDANRRLVGMASEGDLIRRVAGAEAARSWWLRLFAAYEDTRTWIKEHGGRVKDVMTREVVTVAPDTALAEVARKLERHRIKRVPVVDADGRVVGIVSRANLMHGLASAMPLPESQADDEEVRTRVSKALQSVPGLAVARVNATVADGVVRVWGLAPSAEVERAAEIAVENVPGVRRVEMNLGRVPDWAWAE